MTADSKVGSTVAKNPAQAGFFVGIALRPYQTWSPAPP